MKNIIHSLIFTVTITMAVCTAATAQERPPPSSDTGQIITGADPVGAGSTAIGVATQPIRNQEVQDKSATEATGLTVPYPTAPYSTTPSQPESKGSYYNDGAQRGGGYYQGDAQVDRTYKAPAIEGESTGK